MYLRWFFLSVSFYIRRVFSFDFKVFKYFLSNKEAVAEGFAKWHQVYTATSVTYSESVQYGIRKCNLKSLLSDRLPAMGVLDLSNVFIYGHNGHILSRDFMPLVEQSWYGMSVEKIKYPLMKPQINSFFSGTSFILASDFASNNWGHFLLDVFPRVELIKKAGFCFSEADFIFCPQFKSGMLEILKESGVPTHKIKVIKPGELIGVERLISPSFPGLKRQIAPWAAQFLNKTFQRSLINSYANKRIYLSRKGFTRSIENENELIPILEKFGFETYEVSKQSDQFEAFSQANVVVGASGAALANIAACRSGTHVLELVPSDHVYPYYFCLADSLALKHSYLVGLSLNPKSQKKIGPSFSNFYIDPLEFENALSKIIAEVDSVVL